MSRAEKILVAIALAIVVGLIWWVQKASAQEAAPRLQCLATDGDTLRCGDERIRIVGLDTPETYRAECEDERRLGYTAAGRLQFLLYTRRIEIERVPGRDKYGRTLARVLVSGQDVAQILVAEGLARPYDGKTRRQSWCYPGQPHGMVNGW